MCKYMCICIYICMYVYMYICIYAYMYICIYIYCFRTEAQLLANICSQQQTAQLLGLGQELFCLIVGFGEVLCTRIIN